MEKPTWSFIPKTQSGKWSVGLIIAMALLFVIGLPFTNSINKSIPSGYTILADIAIRPALALTILAGMLVGILSFGTGLWAIAKKNPFPENWERR